MTLPSGSEVFGSCYLREVVRKMLVMNENLARIQLDKNSQYDKFIQTPSPVGSVFAAYTPRCEVHRGVLTQILPTRGKICLSFTFAICIPNRTGITTGTVKALERHQHGTLTCFRYRSAVSCCGQPRAVRDADCVWTRTPQTRSIGVNWVR